jgi:hypothetical protein
MLSSLTETTPQPWDPTQAAKEVVHAFRNLHYISAAGAKDLVVSDVSIGFRVADEEEGDTKKPKKMKMKIPMYPLRTVANEAHLPIKVARGDWGKREEKGKAEGKKKAVLKQFKYWRKECELCKAEAKDRPGGPRKKRTSSFCYGCGQRNPGMEATDTGAFVCEQHWRKWHTEKELPHIDVGALRVTKAKEAKKSKPGKESKKSKVRSSIGVGERKREGGGGIYSEVRPRHALLPFCHFHLAMDSQAPAAVCVPSGRGICRMITWESTKLRRYAKTPQHELLWCPILYFSPNLHMYDEYFPM